MRPGPGLVVMALAFISGARRGTSQQSSASQGSKLGKFGEDNTGALSRINPWLSACDLEQPNSAPDLQGQCSAGTLPVAWVDEGPGPPRCPPPCERFRLHDKYNNINRNKANNIDNTKYNMANRLNDKQQCLDYLGDEELSPAQICKKSSLNIETKLKTLRLRHCCERTVDSALHNSAYADVLNRGSECVRILNDLLETDALAARITCEFTEVLVRYDCGQPYSMIHHCEDCKEAYRRWVCSVFIPYYATKDDIKNITNYNNDKNHQDTADTAAASNRLTEVNFDANNKQQLVKNISISIKSSRRKPRRLRIRPCLSVCQTVEKKCPYMLPGDRAPAHPTQYAGEPTFLCRDLNIGETGEQLTKSNNGPNNCCYKYCGFPYDGLCSKCDSLFNDTIDSDDLTSSSELPLQLSTCQSITSATTSSTTQSEQCKLPHQYQSSSASSTTTSSSSFIKLYNINNTYKIFFNNTWTMKLWCLVKYAAWTKILLQLAGL